MIRAFGSFTAAFGGVITAAGYIMIWSYLSPFGLQSHIGDLPITAYAGYGITVFGRHPVYGWMTAVLLVLGLVQINLQHFSGMTGSLFVRGQARPSFMGFITGTAHATSSGYARQVFLPMLQWSVLAASLLAFFLGASTLGGTMAFQVIRGGSLAQTPGVSIAAASVVDTADRVLQSKKLYAVVWSNDSGAYLTPVEANATDPHILSALFLPSRDIRAISTTLTYSGVCAGCLLKPADNRGLLVNVLVLLLSAPFILYAVCREYYRYGSVAATSAVRTLPDGLPQMTMAELQYINEFLHRGKRVRLTCRDSTFTTVYYIDPEKNDMRVLQYRAGRLPPWMESFEGCFQSSFHKVVGAVQRIWDRPQNGSQG